MAYEWIPRDASRQLGSSAFDNFDQLGFAAADILSQIIGKIIDQPDTDPPALTFFDLRKIEKVLNNFSHEYFGDSELSLSDIKRALESLNFGDDVDSPAVLWKLSLDESENGAVPQRLTTFLDTLNLLAQKNLQFFGGLLPADAIGQETSQNPIVPFNFEFSEFLNRKCATTYSDKAGIASAVIDTGIAFANRNFRYRTKNMKPEQADQTRFEMLWLQDRVNSETKAEKYGIPYQCGTILFRHHIQKLFDDNWNTETQSINEEAIYRQFEPSAPYEEHNSLKFRRAHGTEVLDLMAGFYPAKDEARHHALLGVELPSRIIADTSGTTIYPFVAIGLIAIILASVGINDGDKIRPLIVNMSLAFSAGPHNGSNEFVNFLGSLKRFGEFGGHRRFELLVPTGNHLQDRLCANVKNEDWDEHKASIQWLILPDDRTESYLEIWSDEYAAKTAPKNPCFRVNLQPPDCKEVLPELPGAIKFGDIHDLHDSNGQTIARIVYHKTGGEKSIRIGALVCIQKTQSYNLLNTAASGRWSVVIEKIGDDCPEDFQLWVHRDDTLENFKPRGRQSYLVDPNYKIFGDNGDFSQDDQKYSKVKRSGTISVLATGCSTINVAGVEHTSQADSKGQQIYRLSGRAATSSSVEVKKALCDEARAHFGTLAAGRVGYSTVVFSGTSAASAIYARALGKSILSGTPLHSNDVVKGRRYNDRWEHKTT